MNWRSGPFSAQLPATAPPPPAWQFLQIGNGGNVVFLNIHSDGTILCCGDVFCGWGPTNVSNAGGNGNWAQSFNAASMPSAQSARTYWTGMWGYVSAPSRSATRVCIYNGNADPGGGPVSNRHVMVTTNGGATWSLCAIPYSGSLSNAGTHKQLICFNPANDSEFLVSMVGQGLWHCTSYGLTVPTAVRIDSAGSNLVPANGFFRGICWQGNNIVIPVQGTGGAYVSTNGIAGPFTLIGGGPDDITDGQFASDGTYFAQHGNGADGRGANIYRLTNGWQTGGSGTWSQIYTGGGCSALAVDPTPGHLGRVAVAPTNGNFFSGWFDISTNANGAATWQGLNQNATITTGDVPWFSWSFNGNFNGAFDCNDLKFDYSGRLWMAMGIGTLYATSFPASPTPVSWTPMSQGQEGMVVNWLRWVPATASANAGAILAAAWDRPLWVIANKGLAPQSMYGPDNLQTIRYSETIDFAQDGSGFLLGQVVGSLYTSTTGIPPWTAAPSSPLFTENAAVATFTSTKWIVVDTYNRLGVGPYGTLQQSGTAYYTSDGGGLWTPSSVAISSGSYTSSTGAVALTLSAPITSGSAGQFMGVSLATTALAISSGTYNSSTGLVTLTIGGSPGFINGTGISAVISGLTGTGALSSLNSQSDGTFTYTQCSATGASTITYTVATGLGAITITGGSFNPVISINNRFWKSTTVSGTSVAFTAPAGLGNMTITGGTVNGTTWKQCGGTLPANALQVGLFGNGHPICYDTVTLGTAYCVANNGTVYSTSDYGATWAATGGTLPAWSGGAVALKAVPGKAGHLFWAYSSTLSGNYTFNTIYFSDDGGVNWQALTGSTFDIAASNCIGFSAPAPGHSYPSIAVYGWLSPTVGGTYVIDVWRCDNFNGTRAGVASMTWTPMNYAYVDAPSGIEGNPSVYNQWALSSSQGGSTAMGATIFQ